MSGRNKLQKFSELFDFNNVVQNFETGSGKLIGMGNCPVIRKEKWHEIQFKNNNAITLELACGYGEYTLGLARMYPDRNFIGVDVKGARIYQGAKQAIEEKLSNVAFLRTRIEYLDQYFGKDEVAEIWVTFPDPFLERRKSSRRLTASNFLKVYRKISPSGTILHLKTDEKTLYDFSLDVFERDQSCEILVNIPDIRLMDHLSPELDIRTHYEQKHIADGQQICYIQLRL